MVHVQVRDEDLVELVERQPGGDVVRYRPFADVEHEVVVVAQLDEDRRVHLARPDEWRRPHERDPQLLRPDLFGPREPVRRARQARRRVDAPNINPSCQRPIGTPPDNAAWMSAGLDGFLCEGMSSPSPCSPTRYSWATGPVAVHHPARLTPR